MCLFIQCTVVEGYFPCSQNNKDLSWFCFSKVHKFQAINKSAPSCFSSTFQGSLSRSYSYAWWYVPALLLFVNYDSACRLFWCPVTYINKPSIDVLQCLTSMCLCRCKPGFYNLREVNPEGCQACFCFGHSLACFSSSHHVVANITSDFMEGKT